MLELEPLSDIVEQRALIDWYRSIGEPLRGALGMATSELGSVGVVASAHLPSAMFSRLLGLGVSQPTSEDELDRALSELERLGATRAFVHVSPHSRPAELRSWLEARGLSRYQRSWMRFVRERDPAPKVQTDLEIRPAAAEHAAALDEVVRLAFEMPEVARGMFASLVGRAHWYTFVALDAERVVGTAGLFVDGDLGWLGFGAVLPDCRRRGAQGALLAARIERALELGCRAVVTETGEAVPGQPQPSYRNILRAGFRELFLRENYLFSSAR